jgi:hypothetical protein
MESALELTVFCAVAGIWLVLLIVIGRRARRHGGALRSGIVGAVYELNSKDKQRALDVIVEDRAAETRPEYPDGDLPQLESPKGQASREKGAPPGEADASPGREGRRTSSGS